MVLLIKTQTTMTMLQIITVIKVLKHMSKNQNYSKCHLPTNVIKRLFARTLLHINSVLMQKNSTVIQNVSLLHI